MNKKIPISKEELNSVLLNVKKKNAEYKNIINQKPDVNDPIETVDWLKKLLQVLKK
jgi:hypothetical protein